MIRDFLECTCDRCGKVEMVLEEEGFLNLAEVRLQVSLTVDDKRVYSQDWCRECCLKFGIDPSQISAKAECGTETVEKIAAEAAKVSGDNE